MVDTSERALEFVSSAQAGDLTDIGAACPDHLVHTKRLPLWIPYDPGVDDAAALATRIRERAAAYRDEYRAYVERHGDASTVPGDPDARVVLIQHVGLVGVGTTTKAARLSRDLYHRAIEVMAGAHALGGFTSLTEAESFAVEYWPLELYKLSLAPPPGELQGRVALVTGAAGGIGRAVVDVLAGAGACVVGFDLDADGASAAVAALDATPALETTRSTPPNVSTVAAKASSTAASAVTSPPTPCARASPSAPRASGPRTASTSRITATRRRCRPIPTLGSSSSSTWA